MPKTLMSAFGFLARNEFQYSHLEHVIAEMKAPVVCRPKIAMALRQKYPNVEFIEWRKPWAQLDGLFDVLVVQGAFAGAENLARTKLAMMQYGYAKAPYNFGEMRALADLNLAYGPYAEQRFAAFAPAISVGHPGVEYALSSVEIDKTKSYLRDVFSSEKPIVLYAPTWGDLSSLPEWLSCVASLAGDMNVLIKLHHNSVADFKGACQELCKHESIALVEEGPSLLSLLNGCDALVSDQSGAIFDAMLVNKPVVLLQGDAKVAAKHKKQDEYSLELNRGSEIGIQVGAKEDLKTAVGSVLKEKKLNTSFVTELYCPPEGSIDRIVRALQALRNGDVQPTQMQSYVMSSIRSSRRKISKQRRTLIYVTIAAIVLVVLARLL